MSSIEADFNLSTIPQDTIRKIIRIDGVSFGRMRLISRSWNLLVDEHISKRKTLPALECCSIYYAVKEEIILCIELAISLKNKHYFDNWTKDWAVVPISTEGLFGIVKGFSEYYWNQDRNALEISRILLRFSRVVALHVFPSTRKEFAMVCNSLRKDVSVENLSIITPEFSHVERFYVMEILQKQSLNRLAISANSCNTNFLYEFLTCLPKYVGSFWMIQGSKHEAMPGMLFGKSTEFWMKIADAMIENGSFYASFQRGNQRKARRCSHMLKIMLGYFEDQ